MPDLLALDKVSAGYGDSIVLEDVSFSMQEGESLALLGRNGVGKTSLLITLMGLTRLHGGSIHWRGSNIARVPTHKRAHAGLGWVPQERFMFPSLSVEEHLTVVERGGKWNLQKIYSIFPRLHERRHNMGNQLSGGEQQMLAIARGLMSRPRVLLLDEPSLGLAPKVIAELFAALDQLRRENMTIVLVDQMAALALSLADRAYVIEGGRVVAQGTAAEIAANDALAKAYLGAH